jgi:hypothetical protein
MWAIAKQMPEAQKSSTGKYLEHAPGAICKPAVEGEQIHTQRSVMKIVRVLAFISSLIVVFPVRALAGVTVNSPANGAELGSPFSLSAIAATCPSQTVGAMGYSLDNSTDTSVVDGESIEASVTSPVGAHTLHVKAWGQQGSVCVTDVAISVTAASGAIPLDAISVSRIQTLSNWNAIEDSATGGGSASGTISIVNSPSLSGFTRQFVTTYSYYGGERYDVLFGDDMLSTHFFYDDWLYLKNPSSSIANVEMDINQVMQNGQTAIFGVQCDGWSGTWDYTANAGTPEKPLDTWLHSRAACNPRSWSTNTWHHEQIGYSRDNSGNVTYDSAWFDGVQSNISATVSSAFALGWSPTLLTNFQVDSYTAGSASSTVYLDNLIVYRW